MPIANQSAQQYTEDICHSMTMSEVSGPVADGVVYIGSQDFVTWFNKLNAFSADGVTNCTRTPKVCWPLWTAVVGDSSQHAATPAIANGVACVTTVAAAIAAAAGIAEAVSREPDVRSLQSYHRDGQLRLEV